MDWINHFNIISDIDDYACKEYTVRRMKESKAFSQMVVDLIKFADFGIEDIAVNSVPVQNIKFTMVKNTEVQAESGTMDDLKSKRLLINSKGQPELK